MKSLVNNGTGTTDFVYKDFWIDSNYSVLPVNKPGDYQFFGSGERVARQLKNDPQYEWKNIVRFVQDVVKKMPSNSSVGGNVQVGVLEDSGFRVLGYQDLNEQGEFVYYYGSAAIPEYENFQPLDASFLCIYDEAEVKKKQEEFLKKVMDDLGADGEVRLEVSVVVLREVVVADGIAPFEHAFQRLDFFGDELEESGLERVEFTDKGDLVLVAK